MLKIHTVIPVQKTHSNCATVHTAAVLYMSYSDTDTSVQKTHSDSKKILIDIKTAIKLYRNLQVIGSDIEIIQLKINHGVCQHP